jgi:hypothetical protein
MLRRETVSISAGQVEEPTLMDPVLSCFAMDMAVEGDAFALKEARIEGDVLMLVVGYSGWCEAHEFRLLVSSAATKSIPRKTC